MNKPSKIILIDYDMGNIGSIRNMIYKVNGEVKISRNKDEIKIAKKVILPGVGSFDTGIVNLKKLGLFDLLIDIIKRRKTIILGVCLGMQLLTKKSDEGKLHGLNVINADTVKFKFPNKNYRIPHMGWNTINLIRNNRLFEGLYEENRFYFVHSYHLKCYDRQDVLSETKYGYDFVSSINKDNIYGTQFHPEKSHKFGMKLYSNFVKI